MSQNQIENHLRAIESQPWVGIQVRLKWCAIDYYLISRHVQTTEIGQNLLTNLQQPRKIYARNWNYAYLNANPALKDLCLQNCHKVRCFHRGATES